MGSVSESIYGFTVDIFALHYHRICNICTNWNRRKEDEWERYSCMYLYAYMYVRSCDSWPEKTHFHPAGGRDVIECDLFNQTCSMEQILVRKILAIWTLLWPFGPVRIDAHVMQTIVDYMQRNVSRGQQYVSISWHPLGTRGAVAAARTTKIKYKSKWHGKAYTWHQFLYLKPQTA